MPLTGGTLTAVDRPSGPPVGRPPYGGKLLLLDDFKHDTNYLPVMVRAFRVNGAGNVRMAVWDGSTAPGEAAAVKEITRAFAAGQVWDVCPVVKIWATNTTATGIDGTY